MQEKYKVHKIRKTFFVKREAAGKDSSAALKIYLGDFHVFFFFQNTIFVFLWELQVAGQSTGARFFNMMNINMLS
jgi:hypothetical protein